METSKFTKNDSGFVCRVCGSAVGPLGYTSRDHCPKCLASIHVDKNPGDRLCSCEGIMLPVNVTPDSKKGYVIEYRCEKCQKFHKNKSAKDDSFEMLLSVMNGTYSQKLKKIIKK